MEGDLIQSKENKVSTDSADQVAGREGKGTVGADKLAGVKDAANKILPSNESIKNVASGKNY